MRNIIAVMFIVASIWGFFGLIKPQLRAIDAKEAIKDEYAKALLEAGEIEVLRNALAAHYRSIPPATLERLERFLPNNIDTVRLIIDFSGMAERYGMILKDIQIDKPDTSKRGAGRVNASASAPASAPFSPSLNLVSAAVGSGGYEELSIGFSVSGPYVNFLAFLRDAERSLRLADLSSLNFQSGKNDFNTYALRFKTYWLSQP